MIALIGGLVVAGCGGDDHRTASQLAPFAVYGTAHPDEGFDSAGLTGTLAWKEGCVVVVDGVAEASLSFAEGAAAWDTNTQILTVDGQEFRLDDSVLIRGGFGGDQADSPCPGLEQYRVAPGGFDLSDR